ncbi:MAG: hypothetical protein NTY73_02835 [Candidatus Micrarchaeota archaeon]|nr:hypothetical protein [Candidatus Micrarchaeota archaeon]
MDQDFIVQALGASLLLLLLVWFLNPFSPAYNLKENPVNFLLLFSCSVISLVLLECGEKEFKIKMSYESLSLFTGVVILSTLLSYSLANFGMSVLVLGEGEDIQESKGDEERRG